MNDDVFPLQTWGYPIVMLGFGSVFSKFLQFQTNQRRQGHQKCCQNPLKMCLIQSFFAVRKDPLDVFSPYVSPSNTMLNSLNQFETVGFVFFKKSMYGPSKSIVFSVWNSSVFLVLLLESIWIDFPPGSPSTPENEWTWWHVKLPWWQWGWSRIWWLMALAN